MVDAVQHLAHQNFKGDIQVFSRHGLTPLPHLESSHQDCIPFKFPSVKSARKILNAVRKQIDANANRNIFWQTTINSLRQETNNTWLSLPSREQKKLRRVLPWWNIARHRIPTSTYDLLIKLQKEGRLTIIKGEVKQAEHHGDYFLLNLTHTTALIKAEKMVICSGYCYNHQLEKLCGNLVDPEFFCKSNDLKLSNQHELYALGPALGNLLFETTAINEIRQQSVKIAAAISEQMQAQELSTNQKLSTNLEAFN
ncbi:hypothetical protein GCM10011613_10890 [Cellvibrio zantedeschiae]|uniref:FAD-dependent urate hydroxylase HpyO FAD/NAD(P)-binding domain-containing protein n=2 Tax=Cellvibrio zantedeschiae TaxID=1237077 RepID=A0ABQ3AUU4_9GAMM|nr:hypothetical protein GCM10011613_10890 [Cellvibrio zantedeschiae]